LSSKGDACRRDALKGDKLKRPRRTRRIQSFSGDDGASNGGIEEPRKAEAHGGIRNVQFQMSGDKLDPDAPERPTAINRMSCPSCRDGGELTGAM